MTIYKDQLEAVYALIEKPENWTQGDYVRLSKGRRDSWRAAYELAYSPDACAWCLAGAAIKCGVIRNDTTTGGSPAFRKVLGLKQGTEVHHFNDSHTHAEVLALLKSAIDRAPVRP